MKLHRAALAAPLSLLLLVGCGGKPDAAAVPPPKPTALVDAARIVAADQKEWLSYGRTYDEQRFSPLDKIDGVMYVTSAWSKLFALDAKSGKQKWEFDPKVPGEAGVNACCDVVNRGVAAWNGKLFLGTLDGRLLAVDAASGKQLWQTKTVPDGTRYT